MNATRDHTPSNTGHRQIQFTWALLLALVIASCAVWYLLLRQPVLREELLAAVPHRYRISKSMERRLLAPRSILLAGGAGAVTLSLCLLVPRFRKQIDEVVPPGRRLLAFFAGTQSMFALAVVINVQAYYLRAYDGRPVWKIGEEEILAYDAPRVWEDAQALKSLLAPGSRVALRASENDTARGGGQKFLLHGLAYPIALFDAYPRTDDWTADPAFYRVAKKYDLQYLLDYGRLDTDDPLRVEPLY